MARVSWLLDKTSIASEIKCASAATNEVKLESNPTRTCPNCEHVVDNSHVKKWPGLPRGVKFDPSDQELMSHLLAKVGAGDSESHPFIDEFITTIEEDAGICYTHPRHLPGVSLDGRASYFFYRTTKAFNIGCRKRRRVDGQDSGDHDLDKTGQDSEDHHWHKTGLTRPILLDGVQVGWKKIMVLYKARWHKKSNKTNWVMHHYHIGKEDDEKEGEYVISKVFYQQQVKVRGLGKKGHKDVYETTEATIAKHVPITPNPVTPEITCNETQNSYMNQEEETHHILQQQVKVLGNKGHQDVSGTTETTIAKIDPFTLNPLTPKITCNETQSSYMNQEEEPHHIPQISPNHPQLERLLGNNNDYEELANIDISMVDSQNYEGLDNLELSMNFFDSQQYGEEFSWMADFLQRQSPKRDVEEREQREQQSLSDYAHLGEEQLKKDIEECRCLDLDTRKQNNAGECQGQGRDLDTGNVGVDSQPTDVTSSQLNFSSQESHIPWGWVEAFARQ